MPTRTPQDARLSTALLLLGCAGIVASGLGLFSSVPAWAWLAVLVLGWLQPLARQRSGARRFDRVERKKNERARRNLRIARRRFARETRRLEQRQTELEAQVEAGLKPEEVASVREAIVNFGGDLQLVKTHVAKLLQERNAEKFGMTFGAQPEDSG